MQSVLLAALLTSSVATMLLVPLSIGIARHLGLMDQPSARKVHKSPIPRLGGIAIFFGIAFATAICLIALWSSGHNVSMQNWQQLLAIGGGAFFVFLVGFVDDARTVSSRFKLLTLLAAAAMVCGSGALIGELWFGGQMLINFQWMNWTITIGWIAVICVAINFIDGLDGLAAGLTLLSSIVLSVGLISSGYVVQAVIPVALAGSLIGFLFFNWHPAKTFMGDCGSMTIGFLLSASMVVANPLVGTMTGVVLPSLALSIPLIDTALTMFRRRYQQRRSMFSAERGHIHHRLLDRGLSHRQTVITILVISGLAVGIGLIALMMEGWSTLGSFAILVPLLWGTFRLAGSVRTDEMVQALRSKRAIDRVVRRDRSLFEELQLEFSRVTTLSQWWQGVCRAAEKLDFARVEIHMASSDSQTRKLAWASNDESIAASQKMQATIPIKELKSLGETVPANIEVVVSDSLELTSERIVLFSRLMTEYSLAKVRKEELRRRSQQKSKGPDNASNALGLVGSVDVGEFGHLRVALVHDFLYTYCGAEKVVEQIINVFPHCDVFALFDFLPEDERGFLRDKSVTTTFLQKMPFASTKHRAYLPLMPLAIEQLDVSDYDLIISSSYLVAKGVITGPDQMHVCYCHSPVRYAWDLQHQYLDDAGLGFGPRGLLARGILHYIRNWDVRSALGVDHFIANSQFIARRIHKIYRRDADVIHPPVDTSEFALSTAERDDFYLVAGRMVGYKRTTMIADAFSRMPNRRLVIIGDGPDMRRVRNIATSNIEILGYQSHDVLVDHMQRAKALVFAAEEDFGIVPVEALACGTPVIGYNKGGVTESVVDEQHGLFFNYQTPESLIEAIDRFEAQNEFGRFDPQELHDRSTDFSHEEFTRQLTEHVKRWTEERWFQSVASESSSEECGSDSRNRQVATPIQSEKPSSLPPSNRQV